MNTRSLRNLTVRLHCRPRFPLILFTVVYCTFLQDASPVTPAPDGGYAGFNTAEGTNALFSLTTGLWNTAIGGLSLLNDTVGDGNTAVGLNALRSNISGSHNVAVGLSTCLYNTTGFYNIGIGNYALFSNTSGSGNTATGLQSLVLNRTGNFNTAVGFNSLDNNVAGSNNTAVGDSALFSTTGSYNTAIGSDAGYKITGNGNVCIGEGVAGVAGTNNTTWIRNVYGSVASGRVVYVNSDNKLGALASTRRVKEEIKPMEKSSAAILALKPVTFRYKKQIDPSRALQFGLVAEDVAKVSPDLITRDAHGMPETVRYEAVNAMLLNEFLKEHRAVEELKSTAEKQEAAIIQQRTEFQATIAKEEREIQALLTTVKEQAAQIQKVNAQLEIRKPAPQTVLNAR